jgi:hypothetical protein
MFAYVFFMPGAAVHTLLFGNWSWPSFPKMAVVNEELAPVSVGRVCNDYTSDWTLSQFDASTDCVWSMGFHDKKDY